MPPGLSRSGRAAAEGLIISFLFLAIWEEVWDTWPSEPSLLPGCPWSCGCPPTTPAPQLAPGSPASVRGELGDDRFLKVRSFSRQHLPGAKGTGSRKPHLMQLNISTQDSTKNGLLWFCPSYFAQQQWKLSLRLPSADGSVTVSFVLCLSILAARAEWCRAVVRNVG